MTVGELRHKLKDYDGDIEVVTSTKYGWIETVDVLECYYREINGDLHVRCYESDGGDITMSDSKPCLWIR